MKINNALVEIREEFLWASRHHEPFHSPHEGYAVIKEELDELWNSIKGATNFNDRSEDMKKEAIQVGAMALRFLIDLIDDKQKGE